MRALARLSGRFLELRSSSKWVTDPPPESSGAAATWRTLTAPTAVSRINRFLKAGVSVAGRIEATKMGVPQGGPLSPVLANVVLDERDWELDRRGHRFARHADDCNILVKSKRAGERVMASVTRSVSDTLTRSSGGVGGRGREASSYPDWASLARSYGNCPTFGANRADSATIFQLQ